MAFPSRTLWLSAVAVAIGFHLRVVPFEEPWLALDDHVDWIVALECGHGQHVRHEPPLVTRPWVLTAQDRVSMLAAPLG